MLSEPGGARDYLGVRPDTPLEDDDFNLQEPEDLSCRRPEEVDGHVKTEEAGLFRPYCLKDPVEYKYERPSYATFPPAYTSHPAFLQYRNIEDLATAQAILDLSQPRVPSPNPVTTQQYLSVATANSDVKTEPEPSNGTEEPAVFKINNGRTTAYTYEVRSGGRRRRSSTRIYHDLF